MDNAFLPVPFLRYGSSEYPEDGGCVMQVVDWISTGGWTDHPVCVHQAIRETAIEANDALNDETRQELLNLIPRMLNTSSRIYDEKRNYLGRRYDEETQMRLDAAWDAIWEDETLDSDLLMLKAMLDVYDEVVGRPEKPEEIDYSGLCALMAPA